MSFGGFGVSAGDAFALGNFAWGIYQRCKSAPEEFAEMSREVESLHIILQRVNDEVQNAESILSRSGPVKKLELEMLLSQCKTSLVDVEDLLKKRESLGASHKRAWDRIRLDPKQMDRLHGKLGRHKDSITMFLTTLSSTSLNRIEKRLDELVQEVKSGKRDSEILNSEPKDQQEGEGPQWAKLKAELQNEGFPQHDLDAFKNGIRAYLWELTEMHKSVEAGGASFSQDSAVGLSPSLHARKGVFSLPFEEASSDVQEFDEEGRLRKRTITRQSSNSPVNSLYSYDMGSSSSLGALGSPSYPVKNSPFLPSPPRPSANYAHGELGSNGANQQISGAPGNGTGQGTYQLMTIDTDKGPFQVPVDVQVASRVADEKRKRNEGASARFRQRRKEKEREASQTIARLEERVRDLIEERDYFRREREYFRDAVHKCGSCLKTLIARPSSPKSRFSSAADALKRKRASFSSGED